MTKRLPHEILDNRLFERRLREIMRGYAGIYALYRKSRLYYVGLTKNLFGRVRWHLRDGHAGKLGQLRHLQNQASQLPERH